MATNTPFNKSSVFPWLSLEETNKIKEQAKSLSSDPYEQSLIQDDLYKRTFNRKSHEEFMSNRQNLRMSLHKESKEAPDEKTQKTNDNLDRMGTLADLYRQYWFKHGKNRDNIPDDELISRFNTKNPSVKKYADAFLTWWQDSEYRLAQELWITGNKEPQEETFGQKAADVGVGIAQSPWKWGYNMIWQWMDRLWKRWAEQLQGTDLANWVQNKAIELFWEEEVRKYQEQVKKDEENWILFNGREQTDIRTPLLWEERANNKYTKAWEVVWDIATWIALTAPMSAALAPAMAWGTLTEAALLWGIEWGVDTLLTQYGSQWNLDITPVQAALGIWGGMLWWVLTNKLSNLPKDQADDVVKQAKNQLRNDAKPYIEKSIKPTVKGKLNQQQYDDFIDDTLDSVAHMVSDKSLLQYTDDAGNVVTWELPTNMRETAEAISNYKKTIYDMYNKIAEEAWDAWARVNLNKVYQQLDDLADDVAQNIANPWTKNVVEQFKQALLDYSDDAWTIAIEDAQKLTQAYNKQLTAFFKNPNMNDVSKNAIIANANRGLKDAINESIDDVLDAWIKNWSKASQEYSYLKRLYGSLSNIEDEVSKRALVEARKGAKGLSDTLLDAFAGWEITDALLTANPTKIVKWWIIKGIWSYYKYLNSPNTNIRKLFELVENWSNPSLWSKIGTPAWNKLTEFVTNPNTIAVTSNVLAQWEDKEENN